MSSLAHYYNVFLDAVVDGRTKALGDYLETPSAADNAIIYRNTVLRGMADVLQNAYPAVAKLAGESYFEPLAVSYALSQPPTTRTLVGYGEAFPAHVAHAPGIDVAPYLADVARLDRAWSRAHLAHNRESLSVADFEELPPVALSKVVVSLHPSVNLESLAWRIYDIWVANRAGDSSAHELRVVNEQPNAVLVWRFEHEVRHKESSIGELAFFYAIRDSGSLETAASEALLADPEFDVSAVFGHALTFGLLSLAENQNYQESINE